MCPTRRQILHLGWTALGSLAAGCSSPPQATPDIPAPPAAAPTGDTTPWVSVKLNAETLFARVSVLSPPWVEPGVSLLPRPDATRDAAQTATPNATAAFDAGERQALHRRLLALLDSPEDPLHDVDLAASPRWLAHLAQRRADWPGVQVSLLAPEPDDDTPPHAPPEVLPLARLLAVLRLSERALTALVNTQAQREQTGLNLQHHLDELLDRLVPQQLQKPDDPGLQLNGKLTGLSSAEQAWLKRWHGRSLADLRDQAEWPRLQALLQKTLRQRSPRDFAELANSRKTLVNRYREERELLPSALATLALCQTLLIQAVEPLAAAPDPGLPLALVAPLLEEATERWQSLTERALSQQADDGANPLLMGNFTLLNPAPSESSTDAERPSTTPDRQRSAPPALDTSPALPAPTLLTSLNEDQHRLLAQHWIGGERCWLLALHRRAPALAGQLMDRDLSPATKARLARALGFSGAEAEFSLAKAALGRDPAYRRDTPRQLAGRLYETRYGPGAASDPFAQAQADARQALRHNLHGRDLRWLIWAQADGPWLWLGEQRLLMAQPGLQGLLDADAFAAETGSLIVAEAPRPPARR